jgi:hypothetical protein
MRVLLRGVDGGEKGRHFKRSSSSIAFSSGRASREIFKMANASMKTEKKRKTKQT